ncbi:MAG: YbjN domain-containing protein [Pararhodobacter sp.]
MPSIIVLEVVMPSACPVRLAGPLTGVPVLAIAAALLSATPAQAQLGGMITGTDIDRVAELAARYGPAERRHDDTGDGPWIRAEIDSVVYTITFLNCTDNENCTSLQLRAWWESAGAHTIEAMNHWNRERRFSKAYLDINNNATVEFDVNLAGGITAVNFDDTLQWWQVVLQEFRETVIDAGWADEGAGGASIAPSPAPGGLPDAVK